MSFSFQSTINPILALPRSDFSQVITILIRFIDDELWVCEQMIETSAQDKMCDIINDETETDNGRMIARELESIAESLQEKHDGIVPNNKKDLLALFSTDDTTARLLLQQVFGSTELVIGLRARKICTALDMFDWEETGISQKTDLKMVKISAASIKRSLKTWMPKGTGSEFHDVIDTLGSFMAADRRGDWGKCCKHMSHHFSSKDKAILEDMYLSIMRFHKATKARKKK